MILVTGTTGKIGGEVVKELSALGAQFRALVRKSTDADKLNAQGVETVLGDFTQPQSIQTALQGVERVFLLSPSSPMQTELEEALVDEAKKAGVKQIVKLSVLGANSQANSRFLKWHAQIEQKIKASGIAYTFLRPNAFNQNWVPIYAPSVVADGMIYAPAEDCKISWVNTRDIGAVAARVLTESGHEGNTYEITGPDALSYAQIAEKLSALVGKKVTYVSVPDEGARQSIISSGAPNWYADGFVELYQFYRQGGGAVVTETVKQVTKTKPRSLEAYLEENAQAFKGS
ncbi:SDR family oxidoreductase [Nostoc sp. CHAB 5784]|uniref:SDR family oxidoreductase n=1 Tax=Nostoc mirabile TaxID=2907820 RepID=UPI001E3DA59D|nr:SDR family oxidoreductase [Nostoc mirabile]MCC5669505.1 SDR family oxidoreductase [Nostoc mirabile CHAB5784]